MLSRTGQDESCPAEREPCKTAAATGAHVGRGTGWTRCALGFRGQMHRDIKMGASPTALPQVLGPNRPLSTPPHGGQQPLPQQGSTAWPTRKESKAGCAYERCQCPGRKEKALLPVPARRGISCTHTAGLRGSQPRGGIAAREQCPSSVQTLQNPCPTRPGAHETGSNTEKPEASVPPSTIQVHIPVRWTCGRRLVGL